MISLSVTREIECCLTEFIGNTIRINNYTPVGGGSINNNILIHSCHGHFFLKCNDGIYGSDMFEKEEKGLEELSQCDRVRVPQVICRGQKDNISFMVLEYICPQEKRLDYWTQLGENLAEIHRKQWRFYGYEHNNYIGSLPQYNEPLLRWVDFFIERRLKPQVEQVFKNQGFSSRDIENFDRLFRILPDIFPSEPPVLLHGDLWIGNVMSDSCGAPVFIDPAVYYGCREMDIAMTQLFGGFPQRFYDAYNASYPLMDGWKNRLEICNLYPLLVHLNLFGAQYLNPIRNIIAKV